MKAKGFTYGYKILVSRMSLPPRTTRKLMRRPNGLNARFSPFCDTTWRTIRKNGIYTLRPLSSRNTRRPTPPPVYLRSKWLSGGPYPYLWAEPVQPQIGGDSLQLRRCWAARLKKIISTASAQMTAAELQFKPKFDQRVNPMRVDRCSCA